MNFPGHETTWYLLGIAPRGNFMFPTNSSRWDHDTCRCVHTHTHTLLPPALLTLPGGQQVLEETNSHHSVRTWRPDSFAVVVFAESSDVTPSPVPPAAPGRGLIQVRVCFLPTVVIVIHALCPHTGFRCPGCQSDQRVLLAESSQGGGGMWSANYQDPFPSALENNNKTTGRSRQPCPHAQIRFPRIPEKCKFH